MATTLNLKRAQFSNDQIEQELELKDGRKIFKTHNGFRSWLEDQKGNIIQVDDSYYNKVKKHALNLKK